MHFATLPKWYRKSLAKRLHFKANFGKGAPSASLSASNKKARELPKESTGDFQYSLGRSTDT